MRGRDNEVGSNGDQALHIGVYWGFAAPYSMLNILQKDFDVDVLSQAFMPCSSMPKPLLCRWMFYSSGTRRTLTSVDA